MPVPCLFVPGLLGTELELAFAKPANVNVWPNDAFLAARGPGLLQLAPDGLSPGPLAFAPLQTGSIIQDWGYGTIFQTLTNNGYSLYQYDYDWRQSAVVVAKNLVGYLTANGPTSPFKVVCYSFGGLIFRLAYPQLPQNIQNLITTVVYLGTPHGGALSAAQALAGVTLPDSWFYQFLALSKVIFPPAAYFLATQKSNQAAALATIPTWPSICELLPSSTATWAAVDPSSLQTMLASNYLPGNPFVTNARLQSAMATQNLLEAALTQARPAVEVCVVATGKITPDTVALPINFDSPKGINNTTNGDGVVAVDRGVLPGADAVYTLVNVSHAGLLSDSVVQQHLPGWLTTPPATQTYPPIISNKQDPFSPPLPGLFIPLPPKPWKQTVGDP